MSALEKIQTALDAGHLLRGYPLPLDGSPLMELDPGNPLIEKWQGSGWMSYDWSVDHGEKGVGLYTNSGAIGLAGVLDDYSMPGPRSNYTSNPNAKGISTTLSPTPQAPFGWASLGSYYRGAVPWIHAEQQERLTANPEQSLGYVAVVSGGGLRLVSSMDEIIFYYTERSASALDTIPVKAQDLLDAIETQQLRWWDGAPNPS